MKFDKRTPRKPITVSSQEVNVIQPFVEGHPLSSKEAEVLNQTLGENFRNNTAKEVKRLIDEGAGPDIVQKLVDEYMAKYEFGVRMGGGFRSLDPIQAEAQRLAKKLVKEAHRKRGEKLADIPVETINREALAAIAKHPQIIEKAKINVASAQSLEKDLLADLA